MICDLPENPSPGTAAELTCRRCGITITTTAHRRIRQCEGVYVPPPCFAGCQLKKLLKFIGLEDEPGCECKKHAAKMNSNGTEWCRENIAKTVAVLRKEAKRRNLFKRRDTDSIIVRKARAKGNRDFGHNAEWLVYLAIKLVESSREPNYYERYKLRLMRFGCNLIK